MGGSKLRRHLNLLPTVEFQQLLLDKVEKEQQNLTVAELASILPQDQGEAMARKRAKVWMEACAEITGLDLNSIVQERTTMDEVHDLKEKIKCLEGEIDRICEIFEVVAPMT